jgi:pimeloyl-ACP methyl ester carboxylesterase
MRITPTALIGVPFIVLVAGCAASGAMQVKEIGSMHVGGRAITLTGLPERDVVFSAGAPPIRVNPNGDFQVEQMYVQYVRLADPKARYPLFMMHGGGLTGVTYETKPDGKPGWQSFFLHAGHDVYLADAVERGRASWARYPEVFKGEPMFRTKKEAWELFRIGADGSYQSDVAKRTAHPGQQFPIEAFDQFMKQGVPRWTTTDAVIQVAYNEFAGKYCPCVIVTHSQGASFAFNMALAHPDRIKAIVAVEPSGAPDPQKVDLASIKHVPHLFVWGDYMDRHAVWQRVSAAPNRYRDALAQAGAKADTLDLPARGVRGNSHMLMMDRNSDQIARMIQDWLAQQGLMK